MYVQLYYKYCLIKEWKQIFNYAALNFYEFGRTWKFWE